MLIHIVIISILLKIVSTSITLTFGGSGGAFIPSLAVGALTGYLYSNLMGLQEGYIYIAIGMASMLAATNKTPLTAVAFVAETVGPGSNTHINILHIKLPVNRVLFLLRDSVSP